MNLMLRELVFDGLLMVATGIAFVSYMLSVLFDPINGVAAGVLVVGAGLLVVPREKVVVAGLLGLLGVFLAGAVVPRLVARYSGFTDAMTLSLAIAGVVLLVTIAVVHVTTFSGAARRGADHLQ